MLNLVRFDGHFYAVDVGMGAMGPLIPYPLEDGLEMVSVAPRKIRLQLRTIAEHGTLDESKAQKLWCYDVCYKPQSPASSSPEDNWIPTYCFTETEFLPQDYEMMSFFTSDNPSVFFTYCLICTKLQMDEEKEEIIGDITLFNDVVRKTIGGKRDAPQELKTEQERIQALKDIFKVDLTEQEQKGLPDDKKLK